jgi:hypothetical protein
MVDDDKIIARLDGISHYVTWCDGEWVRLTPCYGADTLESKQVPLQRVIIIKGVEALERMKALFAKGY